MSASSYNRGSKLVSKYADEQMPRALRSADRQARNEEVAALRKRVSELEKTLDRARRCLAAERAGREALRARLSVEARENAFGVAVLCRLAFPNDRKASEDG